MELGLDEKTVALVKHRSLKNIRNHVERKKVALGPSSEAFESLLTDIWEYHRFSCPKRSTIGGYLLKTLEEPWQRYVDFHLNVLGCRFCRANLEDLEHETTDQTQQLHARIMESTVGFLHRPL